jgi:hypothetical protein
MTNQTTTYRMRLEFTAPQAETLRTLALSVTGAASTDQTRVNLTGVLIELDNDTLRMTATDSYSLVTATMHYPTADITGTAGAALVPAKWLTDAVKTIKRADRATLDINDDTATLRTPNGSTETRTHTAEFPNWRPLLPTTQGYDVDTYWTAQDPTTPRGFDPAKMATLCKLADTARGKLATATVLTHHHPHKPWAMTLTTSHINWTGLLMPVRLPNQ